MNTFLSHIIKYYSITWPYLSIHYFLTRKSLIKITHCTFKTLIYQNQTIELIFAIFQIYQRVAMAGSQCAVCHVHMEKARVHYGGVSCYSCRAFFRRTTQRDELAKCKFDGKCNVDHQERKSCPPCRYDRCLR